MLSSTVIVLSTTMVLGQTSSEDAFKAWADFVVGSTWSTTSDGVKCEISYKPTLNGRFVLGEYMHGDIPVTFILGIDPNTKRFTWFGFDGDGNVVKWVMSRVSKDTWESEGKGMGPDGECAIKSKTTRIDDNTLKEELEHFVINGKPMRTGTNIWKRRQ